ncbi:MAG TPA: YncE family protein [Candidatus Angelobacter sp.]|nr:YncE family protein [Candidatus Angelobacter sp.]
MIVKFRSFWLGLAAMACLLLVIGCGNTFRQFITPVPGPSGDPGDLSHAVVTSTNPTAGGLGTDLHVNVSGDSLSGVVPLGTNPLFFGYGSGRAFALDGTGNLTLYVGLLPLTSVLATAVPPLGTSGQVAGGITSGGAIYIANSGSNNVSVLSATSNTFASTVATGTQPVMVAAGTADKVYVVNRGSNNVTVISTLDNSILKTIPVGPSPIWAVMSTDGVNVFVVNQGDGTVSVLDTTLDLEICSNGTVIVACTPANRIHVGTSAGSSPNFAFFDSPRRRVYVTNTGENTVSVIKADGVNLGVLPPIVPTLLANVTVSGKPTSVTALADGSRAYAALGGCPTGVNHLTIIANLPSCTGNLVSVIDAIGLLQSSTIVVGPGAVSIASANDSSRVYVIGALDQTTITDNVSHIQAPRTISTPSVSVIKTSTNAVIRPATDASVTTLVPTFLVPAQDPTCVAKFDTTFNTAAPIPCKGQTPFMVRVIP